jgi:single-stranded-DNA-specific exonuclease
MLFEWFLHPETDISKIVESDLRVPPVIANILAQRKINSDEKIKEFIYPKLSGLHDPFLMDGMTQAVERVIKALESGENILIYGDYDVDGVTSVAILYQALHNLGGKVSFFIPERGSDGYGLSQKGIEKAIKRKTGLIITVDCGITANAEIEFAKSQGLDTIVCDHHGVVGRTPNACAILDPKVESCTYPFAELAGCGVAFKLLQGVCQRLNIDKKFAYQFLDLVALGTAADIVELTGENRTLVKFGLKVINSKPRYGLFALLKSCGLSKQKITVNSIVFKLAPRLNAVGRISNAKKAVHLLTSSSPQQAKNIAQILNSENNQRKDIDSLTLKEAEEQIAHKVDIENTRVLVLVKENWHLGVLGIVASRIQEKYKRPTILISINNGVGKGSARSEPAFDIFNAFHILSDFLLSYGGHKCAAGLTIKPGKIESFRKELNRHAEGYISVKDALPKLSIDSIVSLAQLNGGFLKWLDLLAPFGPGNMRPVFVTKKMKVSGNVSTIGEEHLKFKVKENGVVIDAIAFNMKKYNSIFEEKNMLLYCAYVIEESNWFGQTTVQLRIKDFEVSDGTE